MGFWLLFLPPALAQVDWAIHSDGKDDFISIPAADSAVALGNAFTIQVLVWLLRP